MGQFLKFVIATIVGLFLFIFLLVAIVGVSALGLSSKEKAVKVKPNSILKMSLNREIAERADDDPFANFDFASMSPNTKMGLNKILGSIKKAKEDDNIKGIYLELSGIPAGLATIEEIRNSLIDFKEAGKFIIAYGEGITQKAYYLASIADQIYLNPKGLVELKGYSAELTFFKNALDRLEIEPVVFYAGDFKSATEPFRYTEMSEPNRLQYRELLNDFYEDYVEKVSAARNMDKMTLEDIIDNLRVRDAETAKDNKVVDELKYIDEVYDVLREKVGIDEDEKINFMSLGKYATGVEHKKKTGKDKIAVLYAQGGIVDGKGDDSQIGSKKYAKIIQKIREDDKVKAIVVRINSGGGSALASEIIWRELKVAKEQGIPVIASMGDVAASGGYYIPCIADTIVAQENTVTGSIGVFALFGDFGEFYEEKMGFTFDTVKTTKHSDFPTSIMLNRDLSEDENGIIQKSVNDIYDLFLQRVADGRGMDTAAVHQIAQGRVWTGGQAKANGLVDIIGGIDDAIAIAAEKAGLEEYNIAEYPKKKDPIEKILEQITGGGESAKQSFLKRELGVQYKYYKRLQSILKMRGVQAVMPMELDIK